MSLYFTWIRNGHVQKRKSQIWL